MSASKDDRLLLSLLEQIAQLSNPRANGEFRVEGYSEEQVARHLLILRDNHLINYIPADDGDGPDDMFVKSPTAAGWDWITEAQARLRNPGRAWVTQNWQWAIGALIAATAVAVAAAAL